MEKVDVIDSGSNEYLNFNIYDEQGITYEDGDKYWHLNGKLHRTDGPACEYSNGHKSWYLNGKYYSAEVFNEKVKK